MRSPPYEDSSFDSIVFMWNAFSELAQDRGQLRVIAEIFRVLKRERLAIVEVRNHRSSGLLEENIIDGYEAMPTYNHTRGSIKRLMKLSEVDNFKVFIDKFGGRNRLLLKVMEP
ncbi:MAG: class I SAM-dependent methyltransferase [Thermoplasmatales archaeon]